MARRALFPVVLAMTLLACGRSGPASLPASSSPTPSPTATGTPFVPSVADPREANVGLYDALASDLATLTGADRQARVSQFFADLDAHGGAPARASGRIVFALRDPNDGWSVAGTFNGWDTAATPMTRVDGTDLLVADVSVAPDTRVAYKFENAGTWRRDPAAHWAEWDGIDTGTVGEFNSVALAGAGAPYGSSELYTWRSHANEFGTDRDVFVQVPDVYFPARAPLPLLVMHDGNESLTRGRFDSILDDARTQGLIPAVLVAYVALDDQNERTNEYTFGTNGSRGLEYEAYIADELVPDLETRFATPRTPETRGVIGASLGGLISYRIGYDRPDVFARVGGQSSSFFWNSNQMITDIQDGPARAGKWYLDAGAQVDNGDVAEQMKAVLDAKGMDEDYVRDLSAEHDWSYWGPRLPGALHYLFGE